MKSHIGPNGPGRCTASVQSCPFGGEDNHFSTIAQAREEYETRLKNAYEEQTASTSKKIRLTAKEQELRAKNADMAQELVKLRAQVTGITYDDANPERAQRRLKESIAYAESRGNEWLVQKLSHANVLPSGAFRLEDNSRANVDQQLKAKQEVKAVEAGREKIVGAINELLKHETASKDKFSLKTEAGSFSMTLKPAFSQDEFDKLPAGLQEKLKSDKTSYSIDAAREKLSSERLAEVTTESQVVDFVIGKEITPEVTAVEARTSFNGSTTDAKLEDGLKSVAEFYGGVRAKVGTVSALKKSVDASNDAVKKAVASNNGPTFVPARSQSNGLLATRRQNIASKLVEEKLTPEERASITVTKREVDPQLAQTILPAETFGKIFQGVTASLRVTEAK